MVQNAEQLPTSSIRRGLSIVCLIAKLTFKLSHQRVAAKADLDANDKIRNS